MDDAAIRKEVVERNRVLKEAHDAFERTHSVADALRYQSVMMAAHYEDLAELGQIVKLINHRLLAVEAYLMQATAPDPEPAN